MVLLAESTGLRRSEMIALTWTDTVYIPANTVQ